MGVGYQDGVHPGFFGGLFGCLKPVWALIGKAAAASELQKEGDHYC